MSADDDAFLRPFEWLTDSASVVPLIESAISHLQCHARVLHVGSGSSVLGEHLIETLGSLIDQVVNVDKDFDTLQLMEKRWKNSAVAEHQQDKLRFLPVDFAGHEPIPQPTGHFHLAVDKSTLDCTLCSDSATAGLLSEVYRLLNPQGGVYLIISFHHIDLLRPLLENMPGADWEVSHSVMKRQVEDLIGGNDNKANNPIGNSTTPAARGQHCDSPQNKELETSGGGGTWASGSFEPDDQYRRTVNVLICRRRGSEGEEYLTESNLDREVLAEHVHNTNDTWFQLNNPMLTTKRRESIQNLFEEHKEKAVKEGGSLVYDLHLAYQILFTEAEREHLDYDFFLEDWQAWTAEKKDPSLNVDKMSVETALAFLEEMQ